MALFISSASRMLGALIAEWPVGEHGRGHLFRRERVWTGIDPAGGEERLA